jgi:acyl-CoA reductase-like NAD-dependent aldehyde dehydrogenase
MQPTVLGDVTNSMRFSREEIFGPIACFIKFHTEEEIIHMANDSQFGLSGAVWTKDSNLDFIKYMQCWVHIFYLSRICRFFMKRHIRL